MSSSVPTPPGRDGPLWDRTAVVTGASSGIGAATTRLLVGAGARVALLGRRTERLSAVAAGAGPSDRVLAVTTDVSDPLAMADALDAVHDRYGPVDLLVACAGVLTGAPFEDSVPAEWAEMVDVNLVGLLTTAQTFSRDLLAGAAAGRATDLFLISALAGRVRYPGYAVYSAVEAAVTQLGRALRAEFGPRGVRVHDIAPGLTDTELGAAISHADTARGWEEHRDAVVPMDPDDVARTVLFGAGLPAGVNLASVLVLPTSQDQYLPTRRGGSVR